MYSLMNSMFLQVASQSRRFFDIWGEYNRTQVEYRDKSKQMLIRRCKVTNANVTDEQVEQMLDEGNTAVFARAILDEERLARQQLTEIQDRHDEFLKLEKSIKEMHDMFQELATLVQDQGEILNNIQQNVESAAMDVERGKGHLREAESKKISARKKKICLICFLSSLLIIVVLVILSEFGFFSGGGGGGGETRTEVIYVTASPTTTSPGKITEAP